MDCILKTNSLPIYTPFTVWYYLSSIGKTGGDYKHDGSLCILDHLSVILSFFIFFLRKKNHLFKIVLKFVEKLPLVAK